MTGQIVFADINGLGEIRCAEFTERVPFRARSLVGMAIGEATGALVDFDVVPSLKKGGNEAVRIRKTITPAAVTT